MDAKARKRAARRLRSRLSAARFWTTVSGATVAGSAFFVPFDGVTGSDGVWVVTAGLSTALAAVRWLDYRRLSLVMPAERISLELHGPTGLRQEARGFFGEAADALRRGRMRSQFRRSAALGPYQRLERASATAEQLAQRLEGNPEATAALGGAATAGPELFYLALTVRDVEQAMSVASGPRREHLEADRDRLVQRLVAGVDAYEDMVAAAGECLAGSIGLREALASSSADATLETLTDAADRLRAAGDAASEIRGRIRLQQGETS
ncbi:phage shock envelope stress response protein PspM [Glycomyces tarimensis]